MIDCTFEHGNRASLRHVTCDMIISDETGRILLTRRAEHLNEGGKWALPGGYVDRDETISQAAERELREETGWTCSDVALFTIMSRPDRPGDDRQNVAFIFTGRAALRSTSKFDETEVTDIDWFALDNLPADLAFDHGETLNVYKQRLAGETPPVHLP